MVMWASFEIPPSGGRVIVSGLEFADAEAAAVEAFIHGTRAERSAGLQDCRKDQFCNSAILQSCNTSSRKMVSSRSEPVDTMAIRTSDTSSSREI